MARLPPGTGGGEGVAYGRKGKGLLIHSRTDAVGMPLATRTTPANRDERAQVVPLLDTLYLYTGKRGRPRKRLKVLEADKGFDAKDLRHRLRTRGIPSRFPHGCGRAASRGGDRSKRMSRATKPSARLPGSSVSTAAWSSAGNVWPLASTCFSPLR
jgi:Transposase DDE domain